jgi:hypothetical protein
MEKYNFYFLLMVLSIAISPELRNDVTKQVPIIPGMDSHAVYDTMDHIRIVNSYMKLKEKSFQLKATPGDVEKLINFYNDSIRVEHIFSPDLIIPVIGKKDIRNGMVSHLGETKDVSLSIINRIAYKSVVIIQWKMFRKVIQKDGSWIREEKEIVSLFEFDRQGKMLYIMEYV